MADRGDIFASSELRTQWTEPSDIFSVLLILGGDVIQLACAAMTGGPSFLPTPVAFSFGWVAYAISAVLSTLGERRLLRCEPEVDLKVINLTSGYSRDNRSWLLSRLVKTYPYWMPPEVRARIKPSGPTQAAGSVGTSPSRPALDKVALCVAVYQWKGVVGHPTHDWLWWSGYAVSAVQLGLAAVPFGLHDDWTIFLATAAGTALAYASASLPQWKREKWHSRAARSKPVALTTGNGAEHVIIIEGSDEGYDLEALAGGTRIPADSDSTLVWTSMLAVLWLALLVTCTGIKSNTWYLLGVGGLGMLQNIIVAAAPRTTEALGLPVQLVTLGEGLNGPSEVFVEPKVMWVLMELEMRHKGYGKFLVDEFFPGKLRKWEKDWWESEDINERTNLLAAERKKRRDEQE